MRHPIRTYSGIFKAIRAQTSLGIFLPNFPLEAMLEFLKQFTDTELKGLKALSETQLRRMKSQITGNPLLKLSVPVGSAYALLEVSDKLVTIRGSQLDFLKTIIRSDAVQTLMGSLLTGFIIGLLGLAVMYFLVILPSIARAQLLDDLLQIALDGRTFEAKAQPQANSNQRKE